ncbi:uncharacterized protein LOC129000943 [Macrosteles quadrilineatus]|uniref:uncharacterized protein LOC129000943 n=1 Tax=Macrosteles quadrilineatus TaxID=74068 RepID=UPI0023E1FABF|nr:uncharacterized protein LOC129000943 [Macrosteles quadrilineatus]
MNSSQIYPCCRQTPWIRLRISPKHTTLTAGRRGKDLEDLRGEATVLLEEAKSWFAVNRLKVNEDKTQTILCTLKPVVEDEAVKLLGFWLDPRLNWKHHIDKVCVRLSRVTYLLRRLRSTLSQPSLLMVYHALFHSHVSYGLVLWGHSTAAHDILLLQKKAMRIVSSAGYKQHCRPIFIRHRVLTVFSQYILDILVLLKDKVGLFGRREEVHTHNTRRAPDLDMPRCRLAQTMRSYPRSAIRVFNTLPKRVRDMDLPDFKREIREGLLNRPLYALHELESEPLFLT